MFLERWAELPIFFLRSLEQEEAEATELATLKEPSCELQEGWAEAGGAELEVQPEQLPCSPAHGDICFSSWQRAAQATRSALHKLF